MSEEAAAALLPRLKLPKQPYRSRFYRDHAFGRLTGKPMNVILQKNANASTIVNHFLAGLDNVNNTDSTSHFDVPFSKGEDPLNEVPKDLQCKKKESAAGAQLQLLENAQSHISSKSCTDKKGENSGSCSSKKQTKQWPEPAAVASDKTRGGEGVCIAEAVEDGRDFDEPEEPLLIDVEALVLEVDVSHGEEFGITYNADASVVNSTPDPSKPLGSPKPKMRLCFDNTVITPITVNRPNVRTEQKNIVSRILGTEEPKTTSTCFGKKPTVSGMTRPLQVEPSVFAPKCNVSEFELTEEESFCFESWTIPRKALAPKPVEQEMKSAVDIKNVKKKEKQQRAGGKQIAITDEKEKLLIEQLSCPKQVEDMGFCKQNKQLNPEESGKSSVICPMKNNVEEELQNEPSSASKQSLTSTQKRKFEYRKPGKSGEKCVTIQGNRGDCKPFQDELPSCILRNLDKINYSEQFVVKCKNFTDTPNKQSVGKVPISSDQNTKYMNLVTTPLGNSDENEILAGLETHQPRTSLLSGRNKETTIVNGPLALSEVPQKTKSKRLNTNETPAIVSMSADNQQKEYSHENVVPSTSGLEKHQKEASQASFPSFGIKPALSTLSHTKRVIPITSAPNVEPEFELEEEENFCFKSWITIPKKTFVQKQVPAEQEEQSDDNTKTMLKKGRTQKTANARKLTIQSKDLHKKLQAQNKKNKAKYEKQSHKRSASPLNHDTEKDKEEAQSECASHSTFCLPPRQKKKSARPRKKSIIEDDENEKLREQELLPQECHFQVKPNENSPGKADWFDQGVITSKKVLESERLMKEQEEIKSNFHDQENKTRKEQPRRSEHNRIIPKNLPEYGSSINDCNEMEAKLPLVARSGSQNQRGKKQQKQRAIVRKEMSKSGLQPQPNQKSDCFQRLKKWQNPLTNTGAKSKSKRFTTLVSVVRMKWNKSRTLISLQAFLVFLQLQQKSSKENPKKIHKEPCKNLQHPSVLLMLSRVHQKLFMSIQKLPKFLQGLQIGL
ncbi:uncharacterized protein LOC129695354 isoform X2 [Leucoraja erinacea]|uniref:uncharacterized protein LOC129695354 isoform X2 n=1 Tax=Leucoraja erinaceus TaxID=7782 RepID=UPI002458A94E|nr:uncharacterized protein LOC129695354 isoform X2 [Leucoraja erinacea]